MSDHVAAAVAVAVSGAAAVPAGLRWLRVAQREHYIAGSASRFARRWWTATVPNAAIAVAAVAAAVASAWWSWAALATAALVAMGPLGLSVRGRTAPLHWTRRLTTLAVTAAVLAAAVVAGGVVAGLGPPVAAAVVVLAPLLVDAACVVTDPLERRRGDRFVTRAAERLRRVAPTVVAITGSYGKTSTKGAVAHLLSGARAVVASPASFNNRAGLSRAVNEQLVDGTEVFVAEMGTYGPGEIAALCRWVPPDIAVITAIGPVHLERFGSEDRILEAKSEILERASVAVLPVDDPRLAALADRCEAGGRRVRRCATTAGAAPVVVLPAADGGWRVLVDGAELDGRAPEHCQPGNLACAVSVALELGVAPAAIAARLGSLAPVAHRLEPLPGAGGSLVLDDTYNANPAGARAALARLAAVAGAGGRRVVVTPGMVELGPRQREENVRFAAEAARVASDLLVVGRTNRAALLAGAASEPGCRVQTVADRPAAVEWVRTHVGPGDVVLYENDLPDHYP